VAGASEATDVADLGDHQHRDVAADAADLTEHLDEGVVVGARVDLAAGLLDLAVEAVDQHHAAVQPPAGRLAKRQLGEEAAAAGAEEVGVGGLDALAGEQGVDAVLQRRAHPGQRDPVAEQVAQVAQLARAM
jgi:hypothetical protein